VSTRSPMTTGPRCPVSSVSPHRMTHDSTGPAVQRVHGHSRVLPGVDEPVGHHGVLSVIGLRRLPFQ
jgi:hypothetical protein